MAEWHPGSDEVAHRPEELVHLLVARGNARDVDGVVALYEPDAVVAFPPGVLTRGHRAIREMWVDILAQDFQLKAGPPMPVIVHDDLALTVTAPEELSGARAQVLRRQPDGRWLRVIDAPPFGAVPRPSEVRRSAR